ncbi:hypothetical protein CDAR_472791 [Caerostris darwini]|uniref:Uncharacterized protein n=1 Tax=Caerostris darwini TaxID=1538125 RepID=A0AAV4V9T7_9ARAC|nr:hypothetical protein CDAR_472791 [Caerostris darwini]
MPAQLNVVNVIGVIKFYKAMFAKDHCNTTQSCYPTAALADSASTPSSSSWLNECEIDVPQMSTVCQRPLQHHSVLLPNSCVDQQCFVVAKLVNESEIDVPQMSDA